MIDDSDGDFAALAGMSAGPIVGLILIGLAIFFYVEAAKNKEDCLSRTCPTGQIGRLIEHECLCVSAPKEGTK